MRIGLGYERPNNHRSTIGSRDLSPENILLVCSQFLAYGAAFTSSWNGFRVQGVNLTDFLIVAAVFTTLLVTVGSRRRLALYSWAVLPPAVLLLIALSSSIGRGDGLLSRGGGLQWTVGYSIAADYGTAPLALVFRLGLAVTAVAFIVVGISNNVRDGDTFVKRVMYFWAGGAAFSAAFGALQRLDPELSNLPFLYRVISGVRYSGFANHPNHLGQAIVIALPLLIYDVSRSRGLKRLITALALLVAIYGIFLTGSRAALVAGPLVVGITGIYFITAKKRVPAWLPLSAPLILVGAMVAVPAVWARSRFNDASGAMSDAERMTSLGQGIEDIRANPIFGVAIGAPAPAVTPLVIIVYGGLLYFLVFYGCLMYSITRPRPHDRVFAAILLISAFSILGYGILTNTWTDRFLYWPFAAFFALSLRGSPTDAQPSASKDISNTVRSRAAAW